VWAEWDFFFESLNEQQDWFGASLPNYPTCGAVVSVPKPLWLFWFNPFGFKSSCFSFFLTCSGPLPRRYRFPPASLFPTTFAPSITTLTLTPFPFLPHGPCLVQIFFLHSGVDSFRPPFVTPFSGIQPFRWSYRRRHPHFDNHFPDGILVKVTTPHSVLTPTKSAVFSGPRDFLPETFFWTPRGPPPPTPRGAVWFPTPQAA